MVEKKRTLWPLGILLVILLGIVLIVITVRISSKQSIDTDNTFNMKRLELNENINSIMQQQNLFESQYAVHISTIGDTSSNAPLMQNPYYISPVPRKIPDGDGLLQTKDSLITIYFEKKNSYIDAGEFKDIIVLPYMLTFVRLDQDEKNVNTIYVPLYSSGHGLYTTRSFDLPKAGFYQARIEIIVVRQNKSMQSDYVPVSQGDDSVKSAIMHYIDSLTFHKVYFYYWIFNAQNHTKELQ